MADDTRYLTDSERFGISAVFHLAVEAPDDAVISRVAGAPWWVAVRGASWRHPRGPHSDLDGLGDHPAVHISWNDARAYCEWAGRRLPSEAEWEKASRGGIEGQRFPWGDTLDVGDGWPANIWQGTFPAENTMEDGWLTTAPVRTFPANRYGIYEMVGNVWEWCSDWFDPTWYSRSPGNNPTGPASGVAKVIRGGSYLCHDSYCNRYRNAARTCTTPDSASGNNGFRTVGMQPDRAQDSRLWLLWAEPMCCAFVPASSRIVDHLALSGRMAAPAATWERGRTSTPSQAWSGPGREGWSPRLRGDRARSVPRLRVPQMSTAVGYPNGARSCLEGS